MGNLKFELGGKSCPKGNSEGFSYARVILSRKKILQANKFLGGGEAQRSVGGRRWTGAVGRRVA